MFLVIETSPNDDDFRQLDNRAVCRISDESLKLLQNYEKNVVKFEQLEKEAVKDGKKRCKVIQQD